MLYADYLLHFLSLSFVIE